MKALFAALVVVWAVVVAYSGLLVFGFYGEYENGKRAVKEYIAESGVTLDSLRSVKNPESEYARYTASGERISPAREKLLAMAIAVQSKPIDRYYWPMIFGQWLLFFVVLPGGGLVALRRWLKLRAKARLGATP